MKEIVQARVSSDLVEKLDDRADTAEKSRSAYIRSVLEATLPDEDGTDDVLNLLAADLQNLAISHGDNKGVKEMILDQTWDSLADDELRREVDELIVSAGGTTHILGEGSSASVAKWLAQRLRERGTSAVATTPTELSAATVTDADTLVLVSQSGETDSLLETAHSHGSTLIAVTDPDSTLSGLADQTLPLPDVTENVDRYATKSLVAQIATLQVALLDSSPDRQSFDARFKALDGFLENHLEREGGTINFTESSNILSAVEVLQRHNDLTLDPIFGGLPTQAGFGHEFELKLTEFLHTHSEAEFLRNLRTRLISLLHREKAYLVSVIPQDGSEQSRQWQRHVFQREDSVSNLVHFEGNGASLPLVAFSFGNEKLESAVRRESRYGRDAVVSIDQYTPDQKTRDLVTFAGIYLFVFGALSKRWPQEPELQSHVVRGLYDGEEAETGD